MKKQMSPTLSAGRKLGLNKKTITNLSNFEMNKQIGASGHCGGTSGGTNSFVTCITCKGSTCNHKCGY